MKTMTTITMAVSLLTLTVPLLADSDDSKGPGVAPVNNQLYLDECSACHFAYQPGLMPARSWKQLMANLEDHFGENAELEAEEQKALTAYLLKNAADFSKLKRSIKIMRSLSRNQTPIRITKIPYIVGKHDELSSQMLKDNSLSYCDKCHTSASSGSYSERYINIPGYGSWEDDD